MYTRPSFAMGISALRLLLSSRRRLPLIAVFFGLAFLIVLTSRSTVSNSYRTPSFLRLNPKISKNATIAKDFFHLLIPATNSDLNICKTVLGAAVLGYPTPVLINWNKTFDDESLANGGSHLAKIPGILSYLNSISKEHDDDLVLIVDGYDTWFQLRPDVLLSRYHAINSRAKKRIISRLGTSGPSASISQSVLFSSQKVCWPQNSYELACYAAPPSPMPSDLYGADTDKPYPDPDNPYMHTRQRFLNSGLIFGPAGALRKVFTEAERRIALDSHWGSDQGVFSDIFGIQEYLREFIRERYLSSWRRFCAWFSSLVWGKSEFDSDRDDLLWPDASREVYELVLDEDSVAGNDSGGSKLGYEYGIGLDYGNELSHATIFSPRDADWLWFDSLGSKPSRFWHINSPRAKALPDDIKSSKLPFSGVDESLMRSPSGGPGKDQNDQHSEDNQINKPSGDDQANLPSGNDQIDPPSENIPVDKPSGNDQVDKPSGDDQVNLPSENDQVDKPSGNDHIDPPSADNQVNQPSGNDQIDSPSGGDQLDHPSGNDQTDPPSGDSQVDKLSGNDQIDLLSGDTQVNQPGGDAQVNQPGGDAQVDQPGGDAQVDQPGGNTEVNQPGGDTQVDQPGGDTEVNQPGGDTQVDQPGGDTQVNQPGGDTQVNQPGGDNQADKPSGDDQVNRPSGNDQADLPGGNIQTDLPSEGNQVDQSSGDDQVNHLNGNDQIDLPSEDDQIDLNTGDDAPVDEDGGLRKRDTEDQLLNTNSTWEQVPLYTHLWSGNIPVSIHHNAWQNNLKTLRELWWSFLWWQPFARALLDAHMKSPISPVVVENGYWQDNGEAKSWWSPIENKGGVMTDNGIWYSWDELCGEWERDLFEVKEE